MHLLQFARSRRAATIVTVLVAALAAMLVAAPAQADNETRISLGSSGYLKVKGSTKTPHYITVEQLGSNQYFASDAFNPMEAVGYCKIAGVGVLCTGQATRAKVYGGNFNDTVTYQIDSLDASIYGKKGNDDIDALLVGGGSPGDMRIYGGSGDDQLIGGSGDDRIYGQTGSDIMSGQGGEDKLNGASGDDTIVANQDFLAPDRVTCSSGFDTAIVDLDVDTGYDHQCEVVVPQ
jgi:Ca2+-binding RTX toxin-like protein